MSDIAQARLFVSWHERKSEPPEGAELVAYVVALATLAADAIQYGESVSDELDNSGEFFALEELRKRLAALTGENH